MDLETIIETRKGSIQIVRYNKPARKNAIDVNMFNKVTNILNSAANDDDISLTVITGTGDFFSSGTEFTATAETVEGIRFQVVRDFIGAFITYPKLLVAIVNGPAIGIAATTLALCDLVFAVENAYFYTPFSKLGLVAEGCSSFTFSRLIGERKAAEMIIFDHKMSAQEALDCGFINYLYKPGELQTTVWDKIIEASKFPTLSTYINKKVIRGSLQEELIKANTREIEGLGQIWQLGHEKSKL